MEDQDTDALVERIDVCNAAISALQRDLFRLILDCERAQVWVGSGARDLAHWVGMRYGISEWRAHRWIACARALESLPLTSAAFASGDLGIDKVVELTRLATPDTEARLLRWAGRVWPAAIRRRADLAAHQEVEETREAERTRRLTWGFFDEGRRFEMTADLPAADGGSSPVPWTGSPPRCRTCRATRTTAPSTRGGPMRWLPWPRRTWLKTRTPIAPPWWSTPSWMA